MAARYFDLVREMKDAYNHSLRLVESAKCIRKARTVRGLIGDAIRTAIHRSSGCRTSLGRLDAAESTQSEEPTPP